MGTPDFAVLSLVAVTGHHDVIAAYTQPPRRQGRGMKERPSPIHAEASEMGIEVRTPLKFDDAALAKLRALNPDFLVVVAYGLILPQAVLDIPKVMAINGHASLLPRWRGAAPIQRAISAKDAVTGVTSMKMEAELDAGPVLMKEEITIHADDDAGILHNRLASMTADILVKTIADIDTITPVPQDHDQAVYADKITPDEAEIDFSQGTDEIDARLRAFRPFPGSWLALNRGEDGKIFRLKVTDIARTQVSKGRPGEVMGKGAGGGAVIATADGAVELTQVQPQGKPVMSGSDFLNGYKLPPMISRAEDL
jgi:methionyl-tRNA formyltransferase